MSYDELEGQINDAMNPPDDAPAEPDAPVEVETGTPDVEQGETPAETQERIYAGKFKTDDDLERGYLEAEKAQTQARQEAAQARQEALDYQAQVAAYEEQMNAPDPYNPLANYGLDDDDWKNIARSVETNPEETLKWAMSDEIARAYPDMKRAVTQYWNTVDPWTAQTHAAREAFADERERIEQIQAQIDQRNASEEQGRKAAAVQQAVGKIRSQFADFDDHKTRVAELIMASALNDDDPRFSDPDQMVDYATTMYARAKWEQFQREAALAGDVAPTTTQPAGAKARTQTRSTAAPSGDAAVDAFQSDLLAQMKQLTG